MASSGSMAPWPRGFRIARGSPLSPSSRRRSRYGSWCLRRRRSRISRRALKCGEVLVRRSAPNIRRWRPAEKSSSHERWRKNMAGSISRLSCGGSIAIPLFEWCFAELAHGATAGCPKEHGWLGVLPAESRQPVLSSPTRQVLSQLGFPVGPVVSALGSPVIQVVANAFPRQDARELVREATLLVRAG